MQHTIELRHDLRRHRGMQRGSVTLSLEQIAHPFDLEYSESLENGAGDAWCLVAGDLIELFVDGELLTDGYVDKSTIRRTLTEYSFRASGRAITCDLVDCEVPVRPRTYTNVDLDLLVHALVGPFGFGVETTGDMGDPIRRITLDRGETVWDAVVRACRMRGIFPQYNPGQSRSIVLAPLDPTAGTAIALGTNALEMTRETDWSERFSEYHFRGKAKTRDEDFGDSIKLRGLARDPYVERFRPKRLQIRGADGSDDVGRAALRERNQRAGASESIRCVVSGWRDINGDLWRPNTLATVRAPELALEDVSLLVTECKYQWDETLKQGFRTELTLKRPEALDPNATYPAPFPRGIGVP